MNLETSSTLLTRISLLNDTEYFIFKVVFYFRRDNMLRGYIIFEQLRLRVKILMRLRLRVTMKQVEILKIDES
jgi:hypothetical protein